ncbi:TPA: hypothetical protein ANIA_11655 [Aspergillus nidulans FGSC A4]|uniref:Uncharacterized protein n=1 Tax=Emericella nidulans (strain FGSC A4 / ATCC 38163 / CBS 112.46 / NRRL 194 / M139) TaxID=227321 RepID=C8VQS8_EMENI|nr:TPA: hypothetical protein ANIA_11655 [Aspergillus nidulans FGSC A4]
MVADSKEDSRSSCLY